MSSGIHPHQGSLCCGTGVVADVAHGVPAVAVGGIPDHENPRGIASGDEAMLGVGLDEGSQGEFALGDQGGSAVGGFAPDGGGPFHNCLDGFAQDPCGSLGSEDVGRRLGAASHWFECEGHCGQRLFLLCCLFDLVVN